MSSSSRPLSSLSGDHLSFQINELEWVRTDTSLLNTPRFAVNSRRPKDNCQSHRKFRRFACTSPSKLSATPCD